MILMPAATITTAQATVNGTPGGFYQPAGKFTSLLLRGAMAVGTGGATLDAWVQTLIDDLGWYDIANFHWVNTPSQFAFNLSSLTPVTAEVTLGAAQSLAANTVRDGLLGARYRVIWTSTGTYSGGTTLRVDAVFR